MAMMKCRECGRDVSSKAITCPACGVKVGGQSSGCGTMIAVSIGATLLLVLFQAFVGGDSSTSSKSAGGATETPEPTAEDRAASERSLRAQTLMLMVKKSLRNPDSLAVESVIVTDAKAVCATYRAENGFGGMNREQAVLDADQTSAKTSSEPGFSALWNRECANQAGVDLKYLFR